MAAASLSIEIFPNDLDATVAFYQSALAFTLERDERTAEIPYIALRRDGIRIGARQVTELVPAAARRVPAGTEIVFEIEDLHAERARILAAGYDLAEDLTEQSWGLTDLRLFDPDGYYLRLTTPR
jgi:predicted enzyme related to lactoylglutathione lyase